MLSAERLPGGDTTVPVLAMGRTDTGGAWLIAAPAWMPVKPISRTVCGTIRCHGFSDAALSVDTCAANAQIKITH